MNKRLKLLEEKEIKIEENFKKEITDILREIKNLFFSWNKSRVQWTQNILYWKFSSTEQNWKVYSLNY